METQKLSRNDLCPCGSGLKYKRCCLEKTRPFFFSTSSQKTDGPQASCNIEDASDDGEVLCVAINAPRPNVFSVGIGLASAPPNFNRRKELDYTKPITRVDVSYSFDELHGRAEATYAFPIGRLVLLEGDYVIPVERLKPGMRFKIESGEIATVTKLAEARTWQPPRPAREGELCKRRVVGRVKRVANGIIDVVFNGIKVTTTPGHRFWLESRDGWRAAGQLRAGSFLRNPMGGLVRIDHISPIRYGPTTVYSIEIEQYSNYFVGGGKEAVWVHNGLTGGCGVPMPGEPTGAAGERLLADGEVPLGTEFDELHHNLTAHLYRDGELVSQRQFVSGDISAEEYALARQQGLSQPRRIGDTENRALRAIDLEEGDTLVLEGQRPPCQWCQEAMINRSLETAAEIQYRFLDSRGNTFIWSARQGGLVYAGF